MDSDDKNSTDQDDLLGLGDAAVSAQHQVRGFPADVSGDFPAVALD